MSIKSTIKVAGGLGPAAPILLRVRKIAIPHGLVGRSTTAAISGYGIFAFACRGRRGWRDPARARMLLEALQPLRRSVL